MKYITDKNFNIDGSCVTLGKFDGLHRGHMLLVNKAVEYSRQHEDVKSVLFTFDMPRKSIYSPELKKEIIKSCGIDVCIVYPFDMETVNMTPKEFIKHVLVEQLKVKHIIVGEDFHFGHKRKGDAKLLKEYSGKYGYDIDICSKISKDNEIISSTIIKENLANGNVERASELLGRPYAIEGIVTRGRQIGRTIGFPTANILPHENLIMPKFGVYSTRVVIEDGDEIKRGITNIGNRPTVNGENVSVETYISDFSDNIYGEKITVELEKFIRPEQKFASVDELKKQIASDISLL